MSEATAWIDGPRNARIYPLGDAGMVVQFGDAINKETHECVRQLAEHLERYPFAGLIEYVPSFLAITVFYDPALLPEMAQFGQAYAKTAYEVVADRLIAMLHNMEQSKQHEARIVEIPVCYGGELGPDLADVAAHHGISEQDVIDLHSKPDYLVYMLGFAPGFAYLGGMSERIAMPRRATPRLSIPVGSVGIAGSQTGVYPIATPGGWQLIGKTPLRLFLPEQTPPTLLQAGDIVRFRPIDKAEYAAREMGEARQ